MTDRTIWITWRLNGMGFYHYWNDSTGEWGDAKHMSVYVSYDAAKKAAPIEWHNCTSVQETTLHILKLASTLNRINR